MTVSRNGDILESMCLRHQLPKFLQAMSLKIRVSKHPGDAIFLFLFISVD